MKHKSISLTKTIGEGLLTSLAIVSVPISILLLIMSQSIIKTIMYSLLLMYFTSALTIKAFAWHVRRDVYNERRDELL